MLVMKLGERERSRLRMKTSSDEMSIIRREPRRRANIALLYMLIIKTNKVLWEDFTEGLLGLQTRGV